MPIYEYKCQKCGDVFDVRQKFADAPLTKHEGCGGEVERLISAPALQFKGSGWYVNDYGANKSSNGSAKNGEKSGESKSDSTKSESTKSETSKSESKSSDSSSTSTTAEKK